MDIRGGSHRLAANLFGTRKTRREQTCAGLGECLRSPVEQSGHPEIEQHGLALGRNHNIRGLQVTMYDQMPVGVLNGRTNRQKYPQTLLEGRTMRQPFVQPFSLHVLHHKVRRAVFHRSAVEQARDTRMAQVGEDLAFFDESGDAR
jgi:hypothetical protein